MINFNNKKGDKKNLDNKEILKELHLDKDFSSLKPKHSLFLHGLLLTGNTKESSKLAKISLSTAYKLLHDDDFMEVYNKAKTAITMQSLEKSKLYMNRALEEAFRILTDDKTPKQIKLNASQIIIKTAQDSIDRVDILNQINELKGLN